MKTSEKLGLKLIDDFKEASVQETIEEFSNNFEKLESVQDESIDGIGSLVVGKEYQKGKVYYHTNPEIGGHVGIVNLRTGLYALEWESRTSYSQGDFVIPSDHNGNIYRCVEGGTSAYSEPLFPSVQGTEIYDLSLVSTWVSEHNYDAGDIVISDDDNSVYYECVIGGISGEETPDWGTVIGTTVTDESVVWLVHKTARWINHGSACQFRPFGAIE